MNINSIIPILVGAGFGVALISMVWKKAPQDKAMVITGLKKRVISGKGGIVIPFFEQIDRISLENMKVEVKTNESLDANGVPLNTDGVAIIKVKSDEKSVLQAVEQFNNGSLNNTINIIKETVQDVLEGKLREIVSKMTVEEIYSNREKFANEVETVAKNDIENMGLEIKAFTIRDITDSNGYLQALGAKQIAEVKKNASIAQAEAQKEQMIRTAQAKKVGQEAQLKADTEIAEAQKEKELKVQGFKEQEKKAQAKADLAYAVEENKVQKEVIDAKKNVELLEEQRQTEIAEQQAKKREMELAATIIKEAEAAKSAAHQKAEAERFQFEQAAMAEAERIRIIGEAEADAIKRKGEATATAMKAEAEAMKERAEAYKSYEEAAVLQMIIEKLPELAKNVAEPLSKTEKMVIIDNGGQGGASKVTKNVTNMMAEMPEVVESLTGVNIMEMIKTLGKNKKSKGIKVPKVETKVEEVSSTVVENPTIVNPSEVEISSEKESEKPLI